MNKRIWKNLRVSLEIVGAIFMFFPEECFEFWEPFDSIPNELYIIWYRILLFVIICGFWTLGNHMYIKHRQVVKVNGRNHCLQVEYGDILEQPEDKCVIPFDECFTTKVGKQSGDVNADSICGKYLKLHSPNIEDLIKVVGLKPSPGVSLYKDRKHYEPGKVLLFENDMLMAFTKLNEVGRSRMTRQDYLKALEVLWAEIHTYYNQKDVCIPVIGNGTTHFTDWDPTAQELLDTIILSYKLSSKKLKSSNKLRIICRKVDVDINKIGGNI